MVGQYYRTWRVPRIQRYIAKPSTCLLVKYQHLQYTYQFFSTSGLNITSEGRRHLGAIIGTDNFKQPYLNELVNDWIQQVKTLTEISKSEPHAAFSSFNHGLKHKFSYAMRTIPNISQNLHPLDISIDNFISVLFNSKKFNE